jgi:hypothetical protein
MLTKKSNDPGPGLAPGALAACQFVSKPLTLNGVGVSSLDCQRLAQRQSAETRWSGLRHHPTARCRVKLLGKFEIGRAAPAASFSERVHSISFRPMRA